MKNGFLSLCFGVIFLFLVPGVNAAIFYVDGNLGSDCTNGDYSIFSRDCGGSDGNAWDTISEGVAQLSSGDTLYVRSGEYKSSGMGIGANYSSITTVSGYGDEWPVLNKTGTSGPYFRFDPSTNNIEFTRLEFTGVSRVGYGGGAGISAMNGWLTDDRNLVIIDNCYVHGITMGFLGNAKYWIKNSRFEDWGSYTFNDHALYLQGGTSNRASYDDAVIIENNYFKQTKYDGNYVGGGVHIYYPTGDPKYHIIRNNIFEGGMFWAVLDDGDYTRVYNNDAYGVYRFVEVQGHSYADVKNNVVKKDDRYGLVLCANTCYNAVIENNIFNVSSVYWNTCQDCTIGGNTNNAPDADIGWQSATPSSWQDFRLAPSSLAIDSGANLGAGNDMALDPSDTSWPPSTLDQDNYGSGWEIGAFAYAGIPAAYSCTGTMPANAAAYDPEESSGLAEDTPWTYSPTDTAAKCQYRCSPGYAWSGSACVAQQTGPVAYWSLDEGSGTTAHDSSGNGNDGAITGATWTTGISGSALLLDGVDDYASSGDIGISKQITFSVWAKTLSESANYQTIWAYGNPYPFTGFNTRIAGNYQVALQVYTDASNYQGPDLQASQNTWNHLAMTYDGSEVKRYINGELVNTQSAEGLIVTAIPNFRIGSRLGGGYNYNGSIDEVRVYNRSLSATEILDLYNQVNQQQSSCPSGSDTSGDDTVDITELIAHIAAWKAGSVTMNSLMAAISEWVDGC